MKLDHYEQLAFDGLLPRNVDVWVPSAYAADVDRAFPVIYMHDGQNLFEPEKAYTGVTWGVAEAIERLSAEGKIEPAIVVGIWNTENRFGEYQPTKPFRTPKGERIIKRIKRDKRMRDVNFCADDYLRFIVESLKPMIDGNYRTKTDPYNTFIMGSSMGGLISLYAVCEYPEVFGGAGCLSTHWPVVRWVILPYLEGHLPSPEDHRFYFDHGTVELDRQYGRWQKKVDAVMLNKGYQPEVSWLTKVYKGDRHHEECWQARIDVPLTFLLGR
jgi:predicted alpha/beta superfamily hydrolase